MSNNKRYREWDPTPEDVERRAMHYGWKDERGMIHGWPEALNDAYRYDGTKLSAYLHRVSRGDLDPLDQAQLVELAKLIDQRVHRNKRGRKKGRIPPRDPNTITVDYVVGLARAEVQRMKKRNGGKTPRGAYREALCIVCHELTDDGYTLAMNVDESGELNLDHALKMLKRG